MKSFVELLNNSNAWLYVKIFDSPIFFIDFWSFAHLWSGGVLFAIITIVNWRHKWRILFSLLIAYEIIEILIIFFSLHIFKPETIKDQFTDIVVGLLGGVIVRSWSKYYSKKGTANNVLLDPQTHIALFTSLTVAFLWVGYYGYRYNASIFNTPGINYYAYIIWALSILAVILLYSALSKKVKKVKSIVISWLLYFTGLCIFEYIAYHIFGLKEIGEHIHKPLIFDIIHGTTSLHIFYILVPFVTIYLNSLFAWLFNSACQRKK